ncbi:MAG: fluoride efflux transporter CrcB [Alphaproteobacteria bacterium]|nr:MAG: fluoride efflux transporter CrcB [Alphaproteobacteria bacterium]
MNLVVVAAGGALGAVLRHLVVAASLRMFGPGLPLGTLAVNVAGSFLMGVAAVLLLERFPGSWRLGGPLLMTGVLGGFTTFSAFSLDALYLFERGRSAVALAYVAASVILSIAALAAGLALARRVVA